VELSDYGKTEFQKIRKSAEFKFAQQISRLSSAEKEHLLRGFNALESLVGLSGESK
jgi:DNA-binding MarR family transcriptional regulator